LGNLYVVIVPEEIVAQDLAYAITAFDPEARVNVYHDPDEALADLNSAAPLAVIANVDPISLASNPLGRLLAEKSIPFAFTGILAETEVADSLVLASPFSETSVASLLQKLLGHARDRKGPPPEGDGPMP
jgi:hypothetical protein